MAKFIDIIKVINFSFYLPSHYVGHYSVTLNRENHGSFGFRLQPFEPGIFKVVEVTPGSPADVPGHINIGDSLLTINGRIVSEASDMKSITEVIRDSGATLNLRLSSRPIVSGKINDSNTVKPISRLQLNIEINTI